MMPLAAAPPALARILLSVRSLLLNEVRNKLGTPLWVTIGSVVSTATLREIGNAQGASAYLKQLTESLAYR